MTHQDPAYQRPPTPWKYGNTATEKKVDHESRIRYCRESSNSLNSTSAAAVVASAGDLLNVANVSRLPAHALAWLGLGGVDDASENDRAVSSHTSNVTELDESPL
jgi:hypothetical protein